MHQARELPRDIHLRVLAALMGVVSAPLLLMLVLSPIALIRVVVSPSDFRGDDIPVAIAVLVLTFFLGIYGVVNAIAAYKLWKRQSRGGWWAAAVCVTWIPVGLLPFGAYGLFALLRPHVRESWLGKAA